MYIIVWRDSYREPFIQLDSHYFKDGFYTYEEAKASAEETLENEGTKSEWYFDYKIYEEK